MNIETKKYLIQLSHCLFIDGYKRSLIYDIGRSNFRIIPKDLSEIVKKSKGKRLEKIYNLYGDENKENLDEYFKFLIENEFIFLSDHANDAKRFIPLDLEYHAFDVIHNAIIDVPEISNFNFEKIISDLELLNCQYIQIRIHENIQFEEVRKIIIFFDETQFKGVDIIVPYYFTADKYNFEMFFIEFQRLNNLIFYNSPIDDYKNYLQDLSTVQFVSYNYTNKNYCGAIKTEFFSPNQPHFTESQHYNTCLNRKICIDVNGEIKNCPAMSRSFGNIKDSTLEEALNKPGFKDLWGIRKDDIDVCKDCEFRYMCTDCRTFIKDPGNFYSQPAKCPYNPYIAKWEGEEGYITVEAWRKQNPNWEKKAKRKPLVKIPQKVE